MQTAGGKPLPTTCFEIPVRLTVLYLNINYFIDITDWKLKIDYDILVGRNIKIKILADTLLKIN